jgi:prepilin peptidase CpaA
MHPTDAALMVFLMGCTLGDWWTGKVYNAVTFPALVLAFIASFSPYAAPTLSGLPVTPLDALCGFLLALAPFTGLWLVGGTGGGDVKLISVVGAVKGPLFVAYAMLYSIFAGAIIGVAVQAYMGQLVPILKRVWYTIAHSLMPGMGPALALWGQHMGKQLF